jgi:hypothetical protein
MDQAPMQSIEENRKTRKEIIEKRAKKNGGPKKGRFRLRIALEV